MKIKKNLTLISLMLGVMLLVTVMGMVSATTTHYLDIKEVKLNGLDYVTVAPSANITASVKTEAHNEYWRSTKYQIEGGSWICVNTPDHHDTTSTESFIITAPSSAGTYDFGVKVYEQEACNDFGDSKTLYNGIIVVQQQGGCNVDCDVEITNPLQGHYYSDVQNDILVDWTNTGDDCSSISNVFYGTWNGQSCNWVNQIGTVSIETQLQWDISSFTEGQYCVKVENNGCCASDKEGPFFIDNINPTAEANGETCWCGDNFYCPAPDVQCPTRCCQSQCTEGVYTCYEGDHVTLDGTQSHENGDFPSGIDSYQWSDGNSAYGEFESGSSGSKVQYNCLDGTHDVNVGLEVTDAVGNSGTDAATVHILNVAPVCKGITTTETTVPLINGETTVEFTASASDVGINDVLTYTWNFGDEPTPVVNGNVISHTYTSDETKTYTVHVTVSDGEASVSCPSLDVKVVKPTLLKDQEVAAFYPFNYDFDAELTGTDDSCTGYDGIPDGMVIDNDCELHWDRSVLDSANPTNDQRGDNFVIIKTVNDVSEVNYYLVDVKVYSWMIDLQKGWNLISIPLVPETDNSISNVILTPLTGKLPTTGEYVVWSYQFDGLSNKWLKSRSDGSGDLGTVMPGYGYWIKVNEDTVLKGMGKESQFLGGFPEVKVLTNSWALIGRYGILGKDWDPGQPLDKRVHGSLPKDVALDSVKIFTDTLHVRTISNTGNMADTNDLYNNEGYLLWVEDNKAHESQSTGYAPIDDYYSYNNMLEV